MELLRSDFGAAPLEEGVYDVVYSAHTHEHFDDVPLCGAADRASYCALGRCASAQLEHNIAILGNARLPVRRRNEALKWVVHLMADIHQPLHAATRGDRGGNAVQVSFFGRRDDPRFGPLNLHAIWDVHMVQRLVRERGGERAVVRRRRAASRGSGASDLRRMRAGIRAFLEAGLSRRVSAQVPRPAAARATRMKLPGETCRLKRSWLQNGCTKGVFSICVSMKFARRPAWKRCER